MLIRGRLPAGRLLDVAVTVAMGRLRLGYTPNPFRPSTFNERVIAQKLRFGGSMALARHITDKEHFKGWLKSQHLSHLVVPTISLYRSASEVLAAKLPSEFVLKPTHSSGRIIIRRGRRGGLSLEDAAIVTSWFKHDHYLVGREPNYRGLTAKVILEPILQDHAGSAPDDYKVFCAGGVPFMIQVDLTRFRNHRRVLFTPGWERLPYSKLLPPPEVDLEAPPRLPEMLAYAARLSSPFELCRVDFYTLKEDGLKVGEITFFPGNGISPFVPPSGDAACGLLLRQALPSSGRVGSSTLLNDGVADARPR